MNDELVSVATEILERGDSLVDEEKVSVCGRRDVSYTMRAKTW